MNPRLSARARALAGPTIIALAALLAIAPEMVRGGSCGHDFDFHLASWFDAHASWQQGVLYPHWAPSPNYEAGEPRFIFYPPLTWMLGAALGFFLRWPSVSIAMTWLLLAGAGLATYALARLVMQRGPATIAGSVALISCYSLFNAYERTAFGELAGGIWIPLVLFFLLRDQNPRGSIARRALDGSTAGLALALAGAWFSDVPLGVMTSYLLAAVALGSALMRRSWAPILRATAAVILGLSLASIYLLPAIVQQKWVNEREATSDPGTRVEDSWIFARHADSAFAQHDAELFRVSVVGTLLLASTVLCALIAWRRKRLPGPRSVWAPLALIPAVVLLLQLPVSVPIWDLLPKMRFLQFPWRWLITIQAPLGIFFASALWIERPRLRRISLIGMGLAMACVTLVECHFFFQACYPEDTPRAMQQDFAARTGFEGTDEYAPSFADNSLVALDLPDSCLTSSAKTPLGKAQDDGTLQWNKTQGGCMATFPITHTGRPAAEHLLVHFDAPQPGFLVVRLRSYPAWRITLNGTTLDHLPERNDGLIAVPVTAGHGDLRIDWQVTGSGIAARWLSGLSLVCLIALFFVERKLLPAHLS